jgi:oligoribonuclease
MKEIIMAQATSHISVSNQSPGGEIDFKKSNLVWVDMEMTGLNPNSDYIIELATVVTDSRLEIIAKAPVFVIHQSDEIMDRMDAWNKGTHGRSGLIKKVKESTFSEKNAELFLIDFLERYVPRGNSPMCGNTICQDRRFMARYMPELESFFHYRNLDVSTLKQLCLLWRPELASGFKKHQEHTALADIIESIEELRYYRDHLIKL